MPNPIVRSCKARDLSVTFNEVKIIGDFDKIVLVELLGKALIGLGMSEWDPVLASLSPDGSENTQSSQEV